MIKYLLYLVTLMFACLCGMAGVTANDDSFTKSWVFQVYLDDAKLGTQRFDVSNSAFGTDVRIQASFDYDFFFVNVYSYRHSNHEIWKNGCLLSIQANTDDDGEAYFVSGFKRKDILILQSRDGEQQLSGCVKTYAYWDASFLDSRQLLNAQTGKFQDVRVTSLGVENIAISGQSIAANHYLLGNDDVDIELWYAVDTGQWLGLRSTTVDGKVLRYDRIEEY